MISLSMRGREITESDMKRCVNVASTIKLPFDTDIIHKIVHSYIIDDQTELKNPIGLYGSRLAVEIYVISASVNHIQNLQKVVNHCGHELKETVFSAVADSYSLFDERDRRENILLLDIGDSLTELAVFQEGVTKHIEVVPFGVSDTRGPLDSDKGLNVAIARVKEVADDMSAKGVVLKRAVIAGGGSLVDGMLEVIEKRLNLPAGSAVVKDLGGSVSPMDAIAATTAIGLVRYACQKNRPKSKEMPKGIIKRLSTKVVDVFNNYF
jgi:cell division ATPase FtsA